MRRPATVRILGILLAVLLAGCGAPDAPAPTTPPPPPIGEGGLFLVDETDDAAPHWDLRNASVINLNGSFVVSMVFENVTAGNPIPFYNVTIEVERHAGGTVQLWAALVVDPSRHTGTRPVGGGFFDGEPETWEPCHVINTGTPATVNHEILNHRSDLLDGGVLTRLDVVVTNHTGHVQDTAQAEGAFTLAGGPNPYPPPDGDRPDDFYCPLVYDPGSPQNPQQGP